jgi:hypothetical protein
MLSALRGESG